MAPSWTSSAPWTRSTWRRAKYGYWSHSSAARRPWSWTSCRWRGCNQMAKKIRAVIKLQLEAGKATPAPPGGPALGQHGANIMAFCKEYNEQAALHAGEIKPMSAIQSVYNILAHSPETPPASDL